MMAHRAARLLLSSVFVAIPAALFAQGFGLNEIGSCAVSRGYANTASPCRDASTIYWNSAAATSLSGWNIAVGGAAVSVKGRFTQDTTGRHWDATVPTEYIPHLFLNYHSPASKAAYGIGVYVPYGLTSQWGDDFPGRFVSKKASLATIYVQPNFAWQLTPTWSIGGGPVIGHSTVELIQSVDLAPQIASGATTFGQLGIATGTEFAQVRIKSSAMAYGAQIAVQGRPSPNWSVGARFLTPLGFKYDNGDATFTQVPTNLIVGGTVQAPFVAGTPIDRLVAPEFASGGPLVAQNASTKITNPAQVQAGLAYSGFKSWLLEADYAWIGWKQFRTLPVTFTTPALNQTYIEDYNNSSAIRLGAEYTIPTDGWHLRAGLAGVASAAPAEAVDPLLPEQDRNYWTFGIGVPVMQRWSIDAGYSHIWTPGKRGRIIARTSESQTADQMNSGFYTLSANVLSFTIKASF
jgi:long-chain fatty acid transport protein